MFLIRIILIILFLIIQPVFAIDYSIYIPSTIYKEQLKIEEDVKTDPIPKTKDILVHPMVPFSISCEYLYQIRPLSDKNKESLGILSRTFNIPVVLDIYKNEIFIKDSDGKEYWLPIQETFIDDFNKEYYKGCKLTLYVIISIINDHIPLVLINEFNVK